MNDSFRGLPWRKTRVRIRTPSRCSCQSCSRLLFSHAVRSFTPPSLLLPVGCSMVRFLFVYVFSPSFFILPLEKDEGTRRRRKMTYVGVVLAGLIGTILSVSQVVSAMDSIAQRIYMLKDIRWLQHCSTQVVQHLHTLVATVEKGHIFSIPSPSSLGFF